MIRNSTQNSSTRSLAVALAATSASLLSFAVVSAVFRPRRRIAKQTGSDPDIEILTQRTARNRRILSQAVDLLSEPWGFGNNHFASLLAQIRPSPFRGSWGKKARRRVETIPTRAGCSIEVEFVEPYNIDLDAAYSSNIQTVIVLHGINGHSTEPYVEQATLHIAVERKWRAVVLNYANAKATKGEALVGGQSLIDAGDLSFLISYIRKHHDGFLGALGFSMGGAKLVQYLCRTKEHSQLDAAATIFPPRFYRAQLHSKLTGGAGSSYLSFRHRRIRQALSRQKLFPVEKPPKVGQYNALSAVPELFNVVATDQYRDRDR